MNAALLYLVLLKATATSFSGLASLPVLRQELVVERRVLTDEQLNAAVVVTRTTPGPVGLYVVSVGYFVGGWKGAVAGWLAMCTPALLIIPLMVYLRRRLDHPRARSAVQAVVFASAGLLWSSTIPIARNAIDEPCAVVILLVSTVLLVAHKVESLWVIVLASVLRLAWGS